jgi:hypothetical protein
MPSEAGYPANFGILSVLSFPYAIALPDENGLIVSKPNLV